MAGKHLSLLVHFVWSTVASPHGKKYIVDGQIETPIGKTPIVRTIWIVDTGESIARLVTAYPHED
jgi:hypothetical protein